ncbi:hypothetical protein CLC35_03085 [Campylobacter jejuni]|nr:hypothetical protein [Campylobacter jejuni]EAL2513534.1 hypothetical protein [Campylobacter jejuni]EDP3592990.1 hypothetical protein [Campylobacter jejuni]EHR9968514.1 hypothetical protein [Campylobacter jejuni]
MKLSDFDFRIWDGKEYLRQEIYNDNKNKNAYIGITSDLAQKGEKSQHQILKLEHFAEQNHDYGDYDEICRVKDFTDYTENVEIELWTGFYDKNGEKIYEGDILKLTEKRESNIAKARCYVEYEGGCFVLYGLNRYYEGALDTNLSYQDAEIIGNIHEKEDLLK